MKPSTLLFSAVFIIDLIGYIATDRMLFLVAAAAMGVSIVISLRDKDEQ